MAKAEQSLGIFQALNQEPTQRPLTVNDGNQHTAMSSTTVTIADCTDCMPPCPTISVSCPADVDLGAPITFTASGAGDMNVTYNWSVSAGTISSGQGTSSITVDTDWTRWPDGNGNC